MDKPLCGKCETALVFRGWSDRLPRHTEALADCPACGEKWQIRYFNGRQSSAPYQVKPKAEKTESVSARSTKERKAAIIAVYGSVQKFYDTAPLVSIPLVCNTMQLIQ